MKAAVLNQHSFEFEIQEVAMPLLADNNVLVKIRAASLNHHELWSIRERSLASGSIIIPGSDGAGVIVATGPGTDKGLTGMEVVINPALNWGDNPKVMSKEFEILGFPTRGTFAEYISIPYKYIYRKPAHLSFEEAASLPLAGLTAYRALFTRGAFEKGNTVLITGVGGGAALFALLFALHFGASVYVTSGNQEKMNKAIQLGASGAVNYHDDLWVDELLKMEKGFDVIIDSAAGEGFAALTRLANPGGRIVLFGRTAGDTGRLSPRMIFWKQLSIHGTSMGNDKEFEEMLALVESKKLTPVIDSVYPLSEINRGFDKMAGGKQFGKIVIKMEE